MPSKRNLADYAREAIAKNPELIDALMEFERTRRVPKTTYRRRIDITIDEGVLRQFKGLCERQGVTVSRAIERLMLVALRR